MNHRPNLQYYLGLNPGQLPRVVMENSLAWAAKGKSTWWSDVLKAARNLPFALPSEMNAADLEPAYVNRYMAMVTEEMEKWLLKETDNGSDKLYLLRGRLEPRKRKSPAQIALLRRHYLDVDVVEHRRAIINVLLSHHHLAIEEMRRTRYGQDRTPREERLCRFCKRDVETPEHALIRCGANADVVALRADFMPKFFAAMDGLADMFRRRCSDVEILQALVYNRSTITLLAAYMHKILEVFYAEPLPAGA